MRLDICFAEGANSTEMLCFLHRLIEICGCAWVVLGDLPRMSDSQCYPLAFLNIAVPGLPMIYLPMFLVSQ